MKKETDEIDDLLNAYKKTSAARIASEKIKIALLNAEEKAHEKFIAEAKDKITLTVRPAMKNLLNRLSKKDFMVSITNNNNTTHFSEEYLIKGIAEKELELLFVFHVDDDQDMIEFVRQYSFSDNHPEYFELRELYNLNEINEQMINKLFIEGLQKICL